MDDPSQKEMRTTANYIKRLYLFCISTLEGISPAKKWLLMLAVLSALYIFAYNVFLRPPANFPLDDIVTIEDGMTLSDVSAHFKRNGVIRSEIIFEAIVTTLAGDGGAISGDYFFNDRISAFKVARRVTKGEYGLTPLRVTIPEGFTARDIAEQFDEIFPEFDGVAFLKDVRAEEGYLFPDTYFFLPNVGEEEVARELRKTFDSRINEMAGEIEQFGKPIEDIVIMASILEKEARIYESRQMIAGILWKRIEIGMPLQVDAVFPYINGKNTYQLTLEDLKIDSPYNTYKYLGLPAGPIANPGLESLKAAVNPISSPYLYYLSDRAGNIYYAEDFEEHKKNRRLYLN